MWLAILSHQVPLVIKEVFPSTGQSVLALINSSLSAEQQKKKNTGALFCAEGDSCHSLCVCEFLRFYCVFLCIVVNFDLM